MKLLKTAEPLDPAKASRFEILGFRCILVVTKSTEALDNAEVELDALSVKFEKGLLSLTRFVSIQGIRLREIVVVLDKLLDGNVAAKTRLHQSVMTVEQGKQLGLCHRCISMTSFGFNVILVLVQNLEDGRTAPVPGSKGLELTIGAAAVFLGRYLELGSTLGVVWFLAAKMIAGLSPLHELGHVVRHPRQGLACCGATQNPDGGD